MNQAKNEYENILSKYSKIERKKNHMKEYSEKKIVERIKE